MAGKMSKVERLVVVVGHVRVGVGARTGWMIFGVVSELARANASNGSVETLMTSRGIQFLD